METLESVRALLKANRPRSWNLGYPPAVRSHVRAYIAARRAAGVTPTAIAAELGLSRQSVMGWTARDSGTALFVPVEVVVDPRATASAPVLVSPQGYRVEGLDATAIASLLERLG